MDTQAGVAPSCAAAAVTVAVLLGPGCGPAEEVVDTAGAPVTTAPRSTAASTPTSTAEPLSPLEELQAVMLTPEEAGAGFTDAQFGPSGPDETFICGQRGLAARFETVQAGAVATRGEELLLSEAVHVFAEEAGAREGYAAVADGVDCGGGSTVDGTPATIAAARDVTAAVGGYRAQAWTVDAVGTSVAVSRCRRGRRSCCSASSPHRGSTPPRCRSRWRWRGPGSRSCWRPDACRVRAAPRSSPTRRACAANPARR